MNKVFALSRNDRSSLLGQGPVLKELAILHLWVYMLTRTGEVAKSLKTGSFFLSLPLQKEGRRKFFGPGSHQQGQKNFVQPCCWRGWITCRDWIIIWVICHFLHKNFLKKCVKCIRMWFLHPIPGEHGASLYGPWVAWKCPWGHVPEGWGVKITFLYT